MLNNKPLFTWNNMVEIVFARGLHELLLFDNSDLVALCFFLNLMFLLLVTKRKNRHIRKNTKVFSVMSSKLITFPVKFPFRISGFY